MSRARLYAVAVIVSLGSHALAADAVLDAGIRTVAALRGDPQIVSAAGVTRDEAAILTIENASAFDPAVARRRLVLVGRADADGRNAVAVLGALRWFKTRAPRAIRDRWIASALPSARFEASDTQSLSRWITFQAPDLVVTIGGDPLHLDDVASEAVGVSGTEAALQTLLMTTRGRSRLHETLAARVARDPLVVALVLAKLHSG